MGMLKTPWQRAYRAVWRREERYLARYETRRESQLDAKLGELAPESLLETLHTAFSKAFSAVFEKGTGLIDWAGRQDRRQADCRVRQYAADQQEDHRGPCGRFPKLPARPAGQCCSPALPGIGMGLVGAALPDVPLLPPCCSNASMRPGRALVFPMTRRPNGASFCA